MYYIHYQYNFTISQLSCFDSRYIIKNLIRLSYSFNVEVLNAILYLVNISISFLEANK